MPAPASNATPNGIPLHEAQEAILASMPPDDGGYFEYYCVAVNPGRLSGPATREARLESTLTQLDPSEAAITRLRVRHLGFAPASECTTVGEDVVHLPSGSKRALFVAVGSVELVREDDAFVTVFTTSGFLTETHSLFRVEKKGGTWEVTSEEILLQA